MEGKNKNSYSLLAKLLTIALVSFCFLGTHASAGNENLIITEIMYDPAGSDSGNEWIEIFNPSVEPVTIIGGSSADSWRLIDQFDGEAPAIGHRHTLTGEVEIEPNEFLIITSDTSKFLASYPDFEGKIIKSSFSLPNEKSTISLSSDGGKTFFSEVSYEKSAGGAGNGRTLETLDFDLESNYGIWQESYVLGGTPGSKSSEKLDYPDGIIINELLPNPSGDEENSEFIELKNINNFAVDLGGWTVEDAGGGKYVIDDETIGPESILVISREKFKFALNNTGGDSVILKNPNGEIVDSASYHESANEDYSYSRKDDSFFWTTPPTPGEENIINFPEDRLDPFSASADRVRLSEILANPKIAANEYIEIVSEEERTVDLWGWTLKDASKYGKFIMKEHLLLAPNQYIAIHRSRFKFALNNTNETVTLANPRGEIVSSVSYQKSPQNVSYNFDGSSELESKAVDDSSQWRWSKFLTPGAKNKLDQRPKARIKTKKNAYKKVPTAFSAKASDKETKKLKFVWEFGDGSKSYLKHATHIYKKNGEYEGKLTISDESQSIEKTFRINVRDYEPPKLKIMGFVPNPAGADTERETLSIQNTSPERVSLENFKIATGRAALTNHPLLSEVFLAPGESRTLTRSDSKFSLNNTAGKVALLAPNGETVDEVAYQKEKIAEDESYENMDGEWKWITPESKEENKSEEDIASASEETKPEEGKVLGETTEKKQNIFELTRSYTLRRTALFLGKYKENQ